MNSLNTHPHHVSASCAGEYCNNCSEPATHKVGEQIMWDDPAPHRHNLTAYLCCYCFSAVFGPAAPCSAANEVRLP